MDAPIPKPPDVYRVLHTADWHLGKMLGEHPRDREHAGRGEDHGDRRGNGDVRDGDRVAAYLPNVPETMVAFLAVVSVGGIWSVCAPDMGTNAVLDRLEKHFERWRPAEARR